VAQFHDVARGVTAWRRPVLKRKLLTLVLAGAAGSVLSKPQARSRLTGLLSTATDRLRGLLGRHQEQAPAPVSTYQTTAAGDVDSEDPAGSWADDGGGGLGGGQASPVAGSAPLAPDTP
jgi:hypothetical protein